MKIIPDPPSFDDVRAAAARLDGWAVRTPLLEVPAVNARVGFRLLLKAEPLQRTGSFKFRGAYNCLAQLDERERRAGVVAFSSGNHAQGVAHAAALLGIPAVIVMPEDAPATKLAGTRAYGAEVVTYDRWRQDREEVAAAIAAERGSAIVKPYDDPRVIAGQGTVGLEAIGQAASLGVEPDALVSAASGGGLVAGCALACAALSPRTRVYSAEPAGLDDHARSLAAGERVRNDPAARTICDALMAATPGAITFEINRHRLAGGLIARDDEVRRAMAVAFEAFKLVVEPGGAVALATALAGRIPGRPGAAIVVASGGNVDSSLFAQCLSN